MPNGVLPDARAFADDVAVHRDTMVAMRDGIRLATDIYRPAAGGVVDDRPLPVILERTPYGKRERSRSEIEPGDAEPMTRPELALSFVRAGYVVVFQDCRGRYGSEGTFTKYLSEGEDGYDTCAWIVDQPWCNGRIGTMGLSYAAHTQMALACLAAPGLAAMVVDSGGFSNAYREGIRQGGAFELKQATWAFNNAKESPEAKRDPVLRAALEAEDIRAWFAAMPWSEGRSPVRAHPEYEAYLLEQWRAGTFDASWRKVGLYAEGFYDKIPSVPIVLMSSWYDVYANTTFANYVGLKASGARPLQVIMGPWLHGNRQSTFSGDADFGPSATISGNLTMSWAGFRRRWFDRWLKDRDNGVEARADRAALPDGRRQRRQDRERPAGPWRALDRGAGLAPAGGASDAVLPARRRAAQRGAPQWPTRRRSLTISIPPIRCRRSAASSPAASPCSRAAASTSARRSASSAAAASACRSQRARTCSPSRPRRCPRTSP